MCPWHLPCAEINIFVDFQSRVVDMDSCHAPCAVRQCPSVTKLRWMKLIAMLSSNAFCHTALTLPFVYLIFRSLVALSLILAMLLFKPAPLYILDEVDAALDLSHTQNIGQMIRSHFKHSQVGISWCSDSVPMCTWMTYICKRFFLNIFLFVDTLVSKLSSVNLKRKENNVENLGMETFAHFLCFQPTCFFAWGPL